MLELVAGTRSDETLRKTIYRAEVTRRQEMRMARLGACKACSCQRFTRKPSQEQFCDNCGHSRSMHTH